MDIFNIVFIILMILGFLIIIYALYKFQEQINEDNTIFSVDTSINKVKDAVYEADNAIEHLNSMAKHIFEQFEEKQKEFMIIYGMLQDNKNNKIDIKTDEYYLPTNENKYNHKLLPKLLKMKQNGMSIQDMAKELNMGQGKIKLILELGKEQI